MNVTTDVQQTTEETKAKRYKTLFGSALGYAAEGLDMLLLSFVLVYILKEFHLSPVEGGNLNLVLMMIERVGLIVILGFLLSHIKTFRRLLHKQDGYVDKLKLICIFSVFTIVSI